MSTIFDGIIIFSLFVALIIGLKKGFMKSIWGLVTLAVLTAGIYFAAPPMTKFICNNSTIDTQLSVSMEKLYGKIKGMDTEISAEIIEESLTNMETNNVPKFVIDAIKPIIKKYIPAEGTYTAKAIMGERTAYAILMTGVGILLAIVIGIILKMFKKMFIGLAKTSAVKPVDKLLGMVYCIIITAAVFIAIGGITYTMSNQKFMTKVNENYEESTVFKYIYGENPLQDVFDKYINVGKIIDKYTKKDTPNIEDTTEEDTTEEDTTGEDTTGLIIEFFV
jgi:uncharacterized membrane protein required for colicin V production